MLFRDTSKLAKTGWRYKLVPFPVIVGAFAAPSGEDIPLIKGYIVSGTIVAVARPSDSALGPFGGPVGSRLTTRWVGTYFAAETVVSA